MGDKTTINETPPVICLCLVPTEMCDKMPTPAEASSAHWQVFGLILPQCLEEIVHLWPRDGRSGIVHERNEAAYQVQEMSDLVELVPETGSFESFDREKGVLRKDKPFVTLSMLCSPLTS